MRHWHADTASWHEYLEKMAYPVYVDNTIIWEYGDHQVLIAAAHYLQRHILVVTSCPQGGVEGNLLMITPGTERRSEPPKHVIMLGHHFEDRYESLKVKCRLFYYLFVLMLAFFVVTIWTQKQYRCVS